MTVSPLSHHEHQSLSLHISSIPFFKAIQHTNASEYAYLMQHSSILELRQNEYVFKQGDTDSYVYFVLKGKLMIQVTSQGHAHDVNAVTPGEVFGDLAVLYGRARNACVVADASIAKHIVLRLDYRIFKELTDFSSVSLLTKLAYYRNMTHNLRWKLESYRAAYPQQAALLSHRVVKLYTGERDSLEELISLNDQAKQLATFLDAWNDYFKIQHCQTVSSIYSFSDGIRV